MIPFPKLLPQESPPAALGGDGASKLAPLLGITDGAIGHYRMGRRVPQVWVVADALRIQGHPEPEKQAIEIMKCAALISPERTFWKRLAATAMALCLAVGFALPHKTAAAVPGFDKAQAVYIMQNLVPAESGPLLAPHGNGWASGSAPASALRPPSLV